MDLRQLKYFVVLAEELNFIRAAERLHISQPALTRQIQQLEADLGAQLLTRATRGVSLTTAGVTLLEDGRRILGLTQMARERAGKAATGQLGTLDVGIFGSCVFHYIPSLLLRFRSGHPDVQVRLHDLTLPEQMLALSEKRLDVGFYRQVGAHPDFIVETLYVEPVVVALPESHPLARRKALRLQEIIDETVVLYPNTAPGFMEEVVATLRKAGGKEPRIAQEVSDVVTAIALVAGGFGVCLTPAATSSLRLPGVVYRRLKETPPLTIDLACFYRREDNSPLLASFLACARQHPPIALPIALLG